MAEPAQRRVDAVERFLPALEGGGGWLDALTELLHRRFLLLVAAQMA